MIILDTNVVSETIRTPMSGAVENWFRRQDPDQLWITSITAAEMLYGVYKLDDGRRQRDLHALILDIIVEDYDGRLLTFDLAAADEYARMAARHRRAGTPTDVADGQIAAIALAHGAKVATRNIRHFETCGVDLIDPWAA